MEGYRAVNYCHGWLDVDHNHISIYYNTFCCLLMYHLFSISSFPFLPRLTISETSFNLFSPVYEKSMSDQKQITSPPSLLLVAESDWYFVLPRA